MQAEYKFTLPAVNPGQTEPLALARMEEALNKLGFIPNMYGVMANSSGVPVQVTDAIRDGAPIPDPRLAALHDFARTLMAKRGLSSRTDVQAFLTAGYSERQILEIVPAFAKRTGDEPVSSAENDGEYVFMPRKG